MSALQSVSPAKSAACAGWALIALLTAATSWPEPAPAQTGELDLTDAVVVTRTGALPNAEKAAATVLVEEVEKRTGIRWRTVTETPRRGPAIVITSVAGQEGTGLGAEGYRLRVEGTDGSRAVVRITGADARGALFGTGCFLRKMNWRPAAVKFPRAMDVKTSPRWPIRGHQLGYRARANSYDAWTPEKYDQHIRELAFFGANSFENIPFEDAQASPHMPIPRAEMNAKLGEIAQKYDVAYWVWTPAVFDLTDTTKRAAHLEEHEAFYRLTPRLDAVFFPGGDPGNNHPRLVIPFLYDLSVRLKRHHPEAEMWISLQGFNREETEYFFNYLTEHDPDWLAGVVSGPGSPPIPLTRRRLPAKYGLRHYPDITHTVRCQYPVQWWDPAFNLTLGRECINPRPTFEALIHNALAPHTDGFIAYSDGVHDDLNKAIWSALSWDPDTDVREIVLDYTRCFFGPDVAEEAANGIFALEKNWEGALITNGSVDGALALWQGLERQKPELASNWRFQMYLVRAYYDAYVRARLIYEPKVEAEAMRALADAPAVGSDSAMNTALRILGRATTEPARPDLRQRIEELSAALFQSIGLQPSMTKYGASGAERGCWLDYVDYPLNNRWWLEDEFAKIRAFGSEAAKLERLEVISTWENPGPGSYYDDIGNIGRSPHVVRGTALNTIPPLSQGSFPGFAWWDEGFSRTRLAWQSSMRPDSLVYEGLDSSSAYLVRVVGSGQALLRMDGESVEPSRPGTELGAFQEFPVPAAALADGRLTLQFGRPRRDATVNWRQASRICEVWLLKR